MLKLGFIPNHRHEGLFHLHYLLCQLYPQGVDACLRGIREHLQTIGGGHVFVRVEHHLELLLQGGYFHAGLPLQQPVLVHGRLDGERLDGIGGAHVHPFFCYFKIAGISAGKPLVKRPQFHFLLEVEVNLPHLEAQFTFGQRLLQCVRFHHLVLERIVGFVDRRVGQVLQKTYLVDPLPVFPKQPVALVVDFRRPRAVRQVLQGLAGLDLQVGSPDGRVVGQRRLHRFVSRDGPLLGVDLQAEEQ